MQAPGETAAAAIAVAELTETAKAVLEGAFPRLWVKGEVSNLTKHRNGHWYFTLRDATAQLTCVVWSRDTRRIPAAPNEGMQVMARGQLTVYAAQGKMQFTVDALEAEGEGLWKKAFDETKARLDRDGLTAVARKRRLPRFPRTVAVITSPDGAALRDIVSVIQRRNPGVSIVIIPAAMQGDTAPESICEALDRLDRWGGADLLIIGRGGGSREDLWAFNDEGVARALAACRIPTISAVGHETDFTIVDFISDLRAATPSVAAETAVPVLAEVRLAVRALGGVMSDTLEDRLQRGARDLRQRAEGLSQRARRVTERRRSRVQQLAGRIEALSPLGVLARGYSVARSVEGHALARLDAFKPGAAFDLLLHDGRVRSIAASLHPDGPHIRSNT